jgi:hypothetical protein
MCWFCPCQKAIATLPEQPASLERFLAIAGMVSAWWSVCLRNHAQLRGLFNGRRYGRMDPVFLVVWWWQHRVVTRLWVVPPQCASTLPVWCYWSLVSIVFRV